MREAINVPPTKDNLLKYKKKLKLVERAYDLLREKYEALLMKLHIISSQAISMREKFEENLSEAYYEYIKTESELGKDMMNVFSETIPKKVIINSIPLEYMGVAYSDLQLANLPDPSYGFFGISSLLWITAKRFRDTFDLLVELAEIENFAYKVIRNLQTTQLCLNALDKVYRVRFRNIVKYIEEVLESYELENIYTIKKLKQKIELKNQLKRRDK
ncbi:MAG: V-type ATP synthase subunit D [Candidatus Heimdallarchaeota archaeon]|nr:V-type ATP synthase subunit D [Candidatus Heimdallarchaeota archaeon]MCG3254932.1 V-type ATP synthase subunit D [Candidatus Heimdallarchaeota archaeon]MCK4610007.1 V-type ATP synthase subunit D [Candidatus Heimdallarchaeota archaeon]